MTLRHLRIFAAVCQEGSMSAAAKRLYITQPSISIAIKELEAHYGTNLFERTSRKIHITSVGKNLLNYAQQIISLYDEMDTSCKSLYSQNELKIGCGIDFGKLMIAKIVKHFSANHSNCLIRVTVNSSEITEPMLLDNQLDLSIMEGTTHARDLKQIQLFSSPLVAICNIGHPLAQKQSITINDFKDIHLLLREKFSPTRNAVDIYFESHNFAVTPMWESISAQALIEAVRENLGVALLPLDHVTMFPTEAIRVLDIEDFKVLRFINIVYHKKKILSPLMLEFIEHCHESIQLLSSRK